MMNIIDMLERLTQLDAPSGNEGRLREYIESIISPYCDEVKTDAMGNLIAHKRGGGKRIMAAAHMDEIGVIATAIDDKGFVRFSSVGGLNISQLVSSRVEFSNGTIGVIGAQEEAFKDKPEIGKLYIDIGAADRRAAEELVAVGDIAAFKGCFARCKNAVVSKALDNRTGCAVLIDAIVSPTSSENDLYFVFTVQEEVGLRGARAAGFAIEPDIAIAIDVTDTGDTPDAPNMAVSLGKGAAIKVMDRSALCDAEVRSRMIETAKKNKLPYQLEIMTYGGTDAGAIQLTRAGVKTGGISIPTRYVHSTAEMSDINDIQTAAELLKKLISEKW